MGGMILLVADWKNAHASITSHFASSDVWLHDHYWLKYDPKMGPICVGLVTVMVAAFLLLEFDGDPPPRREPWEQ